MTPSLLTFALSGTLAAASEPLLHAGDAGEAVTHVTADSGRAPWQLAPLTPAALAPLGVPQLYGAPLTPCAGGPAGNDELREAVRVGERHLILQRWAEADELLARAASRQSCLSEASEASLLARLHFLRGLIAYQQGEEAAASAAFRLARRFSPAMTWDPRFPPKGQELFDAAADPGPGAATLVVPGSGAGDAVWVNGRLQSLGDGGLSLPAGPHLVQVLGDQNFTFLATVSPGETVVLVEPTRVQGLDLTAMAGTPELAALLRAIAPQAAVAWLWTGRRTWKLTPAGWQDLEPTDPTAKVRATRTATAMQAAGLTAAAVGAAGLSWGVIGFSRNQAPPRWESTTDQRDARTADAAAFRNATIASGGLIVAGGVIAAIGRHRTAATWALEPGLGGLSLRYTR